MAAEDATGFKPSAAFFDRKKAAMVLCFAFAAALCGGFVMNLANSIVQFQFPSGGCPSATETL